MPDSSPTSSDASGLRSDLRAALAHVLWVAGSPCAGKSSIAHAIARIYVFVDYHADAFARTHFARRVAAGDAEAVAFLRMSDDQRWLRRSVAEVARETIDSWTREFALVVEDLLALPRENLIVAEGNFFPSTVAPYLSSPHQAIWLVPTDTFCARARRQKRDALARRKQRHGIDEESSNPEERLRTLIERDCLLARHVRDEAAALGLPVVEVNGSRPVEEMTEAVEHHFDPYLIDWLGRSRRAGQ